MNSSNTDRIEKKILLRAPVSRVWRALTDAREFGDWFRAVMEGPFVAGRRMSGRVAEPGYEHIHFEITIEKMEPERLFSWRWHPHAIDPAQDYSAEPTTLVEFTLTAAEGGTLLTVAESGFDSIPLARRLEAYRGNEGGWTIQMERVERYLAAAS